MSADASELLASLRGLRDTDLERARAYYADVVRFLEREQRDRQARQDRDIARARRPDPRPRQAEIADAVDAAQAHFDTRAAAIESVAVQRGWHVQQVRYSYEAGKRYRREQEKAARDRTIMREANKGRSDRQIAATAGVSRSTVQRVIRANKP